MLIPGSGTGSTLTAEDFREVDQSVRVKKSTVSKATLDGVGQLLQARDFHPAAKEYSYGWYHNLVEDTLVVQTDAPAEVMAPVQVAFGSRVNLGYGVAGLSSRLNDPAPHWGGAGWRPQEPTPSARAGSPFRPLPALGSW